MSDNKNKKAIAVAFSIGLELIAFSLAGVFLGHTIGKSFAKAEIGAILGVLVGFAVWTWRLIQSKKYIL